MAVPTRETAILFYLLSGTDNTTNGTTDNSSSNSNTSPGTDACGSITTTTQGLSAASTK